MQKSRTLPVVSRPLVEADLSPERRVLQRIATNAVREACEVRKGRLTPRAILAYQWLTEAGTSGQIWTLAWVCLELGWDGENFRARALKYVHKSWRALAWREFIADLERRSRQVRTLAQGGGSDYLPLVELTYWHEIADVDLPDKWPQGLDFGEAPGGSGLQKDPLGFDGWGFGAQTGLDDFPEKDLDDGCAADAGGDGRCDDADRDGEKS